MRLPGCIVPAIWFRCHHGHSTLITMKRFTKIIQQRQLKQMAKDYVFIFVGICLYSVGYCAFLLPEKIVMGGVTGISTLFYYSLGWNPAIMLWVINVLLLAIAFRFLASESINSFHTIF